MMLAKLVRGRIAPARIDEAARAVHEELIPRFLGHPGARHGYWMANRETGHVLIATVWSDSASLQDAEARDGAERAAVGERVGLRVSVVQALDLLGMHETGDAERPVFRWARAVWVEGVPAEHHGELPLMHRAAVSEQVRSGGFCGSYWLGDRDTGNGLGLSLWERPADLTATRRESRRRQRRFAEVLGCRINAVTEYEALGVAAPLAIAAVEHPAATGSIPR